MNRNFPLSDELLNSARAEFRKYGFAEANVGRIATAAGISKKTIYKYVPSKEALLVEVMRSVVSGPAATMDLSDANTSPRKWLTAYLTRFAQLAFSEEGVTSYRLMMSEGTRFPEVARIYIETIKAFGIRPLADQLSNYTSTGTLVVTDTVRSATMLMAMVLADALRDAALGIAPPPKGMELDDLVASSVDVFFYGVAVKGTGHRL
ncbi:TetR/AcrR family transcriptional regulator (plasmid) [Sphingomonas sp. NY01]|uniref:TetR/AcrR family transcriptional regulator n=1 Tax=Sphingomonas sp. NY01 TaxID=2968057 RepID=UPI00315DEFAE